MCKSGNLTTPNVVVTKKGLLGAYVNDACWVPCESGDTAVDKVWPVSDPVTKCSVFDGT